MPALCNEPCSRRAEGLQYPSTRFSEVLMDRLTGSAAFAAVLLCTTLCACGGGSSSSGAAASPSGGASGPTATIQGVSTPSTISVVTPKNAP